MDRSDEATDLFEKAQASAAAGQEPRAIWYLTHSLKCQLRAVSFLQKARLYAALGWAVKADDIDAGLQCALSEGNDEVHKQIKEFRSQYLPEIGASVYNGHEAQTTDHMVQSGDVRKLLTFFRLEKHADEITVTLKPCLRLSRSIDPTDSAPSKFGGLPFVPSNFIWPRSTTGAPLSFLCQIDLFNVAESALTMGLPADGVLAFFYDNKEQPWGFNHSDKTGWRVHYFQDASQLARAAEPPDLASADRFLPCAISTEPFSSPADYRDEELSNLGLAEDEIRNYMDFCETWEAGKPKHQLGGKPLLVQGDWRVECALASKGIQIEGQEALESNSTLVDTANQWQLLLQIDSDDLSTFEWGDSGRLYFAITTADLAARNFDRVWLILQCY